ncbi:helix-hairpin-helix domain-containing protein [uncultured Acetobacteroides sp.]|uniref:ComEA family DNA-binding protein n=1 Tax=uncultured Acetobacteroides sp. TaxID=1760811 RepID=UPI0029F4CB84|nr:helix-hairpin-helix domain-containing protein [uncultured Acetobacteroides sp.]
MITIKRYIKEFLTFAKWEQRGIILLSAVFVALMIFTISYNPKQKVLVTPDISRKIKDFERQVMLSEKKSRIGSAEMGWSNFSSYSNSRNNFTPFKFDPNTATLEEYQALGFSLKQSQSLLNYRAKGGRFRKPEDFKRSFVVSGEHYKRLAAYIVIQNSTKDTVPWHVYQPVVFQLVDLNDADTTSLKTLKGIGSAIAKRIVDYRRRLGGFARNEQLLEVYGIDSSKYSLLQNQLKRPSKWTKICINTADVETLKRHPYISPYEARNIVYFRTKRGSIRNLQQLVSDRIISKSTSEKLGEYVDYSN